MSKVDYVKKVFPEILGIKNPDLREKTAQVWAKAMELGGWDTLDDIPFTLLIPDVELGLVDHTRSVTRTAVAVAKERGDLNTDLVISAGLLHDVGKVMEYERKDGEVVKSGFGKLVRHPVSGAGLAMESGLPDEVVHIIAAHAKEGEMVKRIPEAILIHHCDFIYFEIAKARAGL